MAKEFNRKLKEFGFFLIAIKAGCLEAFKNNANMFFVFLHAVRPDDYVIQVNMADLANVFAERGCDPPLLDRGGVSQALWHD
jgi:hypothetical protein